MATLSLFQLQGLNRTFSCSVNHLSVDHKAVIPASTIPRKAFNLSSNTTFGQSFFLKSGQPQRTSERVRYGASGCRAESGSNNDVKQGTLDHIPVSPFYKVEAVIRSWRLQGVTEALLEEGIRGLTVTEVRGFGAQRGSLERQAGSEFVESAFLQKTKIEIVVVADQVDTVIDTIIDAAKTEEIGDGKIFVSPIYEVIRVRTGERGVQAERMAGGRSDLLNIGQKD